jgi:hypothetical protein
MSLAPARALWPASLLPLAFAACAPPPAAPAAPVPAPAAAATAGHHHRKAVHIGTAEAAARPSEQEAVVDDVPDPEALALFEKRLAQPAVPFGPASSVPRVTAIALDDTARRAARDMKPIGEVAGVTLAEGQRAEMPVTLAPGGCATFIAQGGLGVIEVDVFLVLADRSKGVHILAEDPTTGPLGVIGGHGACYKNPHDAPLAAELHVAVRRGAGVVLVRGFEK